MKKAQKNSQFFIFEEIKNEALVESSFHKLKQMINSYIKSLDGFINQPFFLFHKF